MNNFASLKNEQKIIYQQKIQSCVDSFGGTNYFLHLLEEIRETKPHILTSKYSKFDCKWGYVSWNKVIFKDKLLSLSQAKINEKKTGVLLPKQNEKGHKNILNAIYTLMPLKFTIKPKSDHSLEGFGCTIFDTQEKDIQKTTLNPIFDSLFFSSVAEVKKILSFKAQD